MISPDTLGQPVLTHNAVAQRPAAGGRHSGHRPTLGLARMIGRMRNPKVLAIAAAAAGQVVMLGAMALVSRRYPASALTQYGVFFALFNILQIANSLRTEQGLVYEHEPAHRRALYAGALALVIPVSLVTGVVSAVYLAANAVMAAAAGLFTLAVVVAADASAIARINIQALAALDRFRTLPWLNFLRPAAIGVAQIAAIGLMARSGMALAGAFALAQIAFAAITFILLGWREVGAAAQESPRAIHKALVRNRQFIVFSLPQNLLYVLSESLLPLSLPFLFPGSAAVAMFWLASRAVFAPATIVAESIRPMIYREVARAGPNMARMCFLTAALLALPIVAGLGVLAVAGGPIFALIFGHQWAGANDYALVLGMLVAFNMAILPFVGALPVLGMQRAILMAEIIGMAVRGAALYGHHWTSAGAAVAASTFAYVGVMSVFLASVIRRLLVSHGAAPVFVPAVAARPLRVGLFGVPGVNRGDDAISVVLRSWLRGGGAVRTTVAGLRAGPGIDLVIDRRSLRGMWGLARAILAQDVIVIGGGSLVQDKHGGNRIKGVLGYAWTVTMLAKLSGRPVASACLGVDALATSAGRRAAREVLGRLSWISVRDPLSAANARALLGRNVPIVELPDPAFAFALPAPPAAHGRIILAPAFEGRDEARIVAVFVAIAREIHARSPETIFRLIAMDNRAEEDGGKIRLIGRVLAKAGIRCERAADGDVDSAAAELRGAAAVVAMRLHALILAYGFVPAFCISRTTKTEALMMAYDIAGCDIHDDPGAIAIAAIAAMADIARLRQQAARKSEIAHECEQAAKALSAAIRGQAR